MLDPNPRIRIKSVAQGCRNLPLVAGLKESPLWPRGSWVNVHKKSL